MILLKSRHGFTLIEIMIVIAIIGIIFGSMNYLSPGPRISRTNSERIATAVQDSIKSAQRDILIGRNPSSSIPVVKKIVTISVGPTPRITTNYITANSQTGVESTLNYPFYDGDKKFQLRDISLFATRPSAGIEQAGGSFVSFTGLTNISIAFNNDRTITLDSTDPVFTAAKNAGVITQSNIRYTMITTGYDAYEVKTRIDRVSGIVDALPMVQNTGTIITPPIYTWSTSDYSACTLSCGGGTQTRTTVCRDINDLVVDDSSCDIALKPDLSLACNTQACPINGTCGPADSVPSSTLPNFGLCSSGSGSTPIVNPAVPPATNDYWIWTCSGSNSGVTSNCSALKQTNYCIAGGVVSCIASGAVAPPVSPYALCTAAGQTYTATTTYPGCNEADKIVCTENGAGYTWSMCNVGSTTAGTTSASYGSYFQWGRNDTGWTASLNQPDNSWGGQSTTSTGGIYSNISAGDQLLMQGPCVVGYHVPTAKEWKDIFALGSIRTTIKIPLSGFKDSTSGVLGNQGTRGSYWTSSPTSTTLSFNMEFGTYDYFNNGAFKSSAQSIRCIKN